MPEHDDITMVSVVSVDEMGIFVSLLEYNNIEGMIVLPESNHPKFMARCRKPFQVGRKKVARVVRVNKDRCFIDLSTRLVSAEAEVQCKEKYARGRVVNRILRRTAKQLKIKTNEEFDQLYEKLVFPLDDKYGQSGGCFDVFCRAINGDERPLNESCQMDQQTKDILLTSIRQELPVDEGVFEDV